jgi:beta-lactam-binding protein with PASTA domain
MIDVISLTPEEAASFLRREGYTVTLQQKYSDTVTKGLCCGTFPAAGEIAEGGSEVILYVSLGYENKS